MSILYLQFWTFSYTIIFLNVHFASVDNNDVPGRRYLETLARSSSEVIVFACTKACRATYP